MTKPVSVLDLNNIIESYESLLKMSREITDGPPFFMSSGDDDFAMLSATGDVATLAWPELEGGYYNSYTMEKQSVEFPTELLLMTPEELRWWKKDENEKYEAAEKKRREVNQRERAKAQQAQELTMLAHLQAKYGTKT